MSKRSEYSARHLSVLEGLEAVRKRPGMYIGSTDSRGLMHCLWEIIDNSVDEALADFASTITITMHSDGSVEVSDDGRGIPVDVEPRTGLSGLEVVFTKLHAGGKFGGGSYTASGGLHGVGASVVNALSSRLDVEVDRGGKTYRMQFRRGEPGTFTDKGQPKPDAAFSAYKEPQQPEVIGKAKRGVTGTRVRYWADPQIFTPDAQFDATALERRARQTAFLVPGLRIVLRDERRLKQADGTRAEITEEVMQYDGGLTEFVDHLALDASVTDTWKLQGSGTFTESVPVLDDQGHATMQDVERTCDVDIALRWGIGYDTTVRSFVNIIATPKGGTHLAGFENGLTRAVRDAIKANARRLKAGEDKPEKDDVMAGLTAVVTVRLAEPQFEGQTKEVDRSELFIVEGDSALGTARLARSSEFQALLPIRGKILNVQKASVADMLSNAECAAIIQVVGAGSGRTFELDQARYQKVIIMTDADVDGAHIRTLLLTLFYRYMRPMIEDGRVYAAVPPLHRIEIVHRGSKPNEVLYTYSEAELHQVLKRIEEEGLSYKEPIQRYKGLGEMDAEQLAETTMDRQTRTLRRVRLEEASSAERIFDLLMGSDVAPRKEFLIESADRLEKEQIDA